MPYQAPHRGPNHDALDVFLGEWNASGTSFGASDPSGDPRAHGEPWISSHSAHWHSGSFFLFQDERATIAGRPFDTFSVLGVDPASGGYFARTFENHGFYRHYALAVDAGVWSFTGATERARIEFNDDDRRQTIVWEYKPGEQWLLLCERTAIRSDR